MVIRNAVLCSSMKLLCFFASSPPPPPLYHYWLGAKLYELNIAFQEVFIEICCFVFSEARSARNKALANGTLVSRVTFLSSSTMSFSQTQRYSSIKEPNTLIGYPGVSSSQQSDSPFHRTKENQGKCFANTEAHFIQSDAGLFVIVLLHFLLL